MAELSAVLTGGSADWADSPEARFSGAFDQFEQLMDVPPYLNVADLGAGGFARKALVTYLCLVRNASDSAPPSTPPPVTEPHGEGLHSSSAAPGLAAMTNNFPQGLLSPDVSAEEIRTMGYMRLKKWLVAQGLEAGTVSGCMNHEDLLELAQFHGFLTLGRAPSEPQIYREEYNTNMQQHRDRRVADHVSHKHKSNKVDVPTQIPVRSPERLNFLGPTQQLSLSPRR